VLNWRFAINWLTVFQRYETAKTQVVELRDEILPDAEESLKLTTAGYRAGEVSFAQVLQARQTFGETHLAYSLREPTCGSRSWNSTGCC